MTALIVIVAAIVGVALAIAILALAGSARGKQTPPMPDTQPYDPDTERAITQAMTIQDQPIYFARVVDMLAQRRVDDIAHRNQDGV